MKLDEFKKEIQFWTNRQLLDYKAIGINEFLALNDEIKYRLNKIGKENLE